MRNFLLAVIGAALAAAIIVTVTLHFGIHNVVRGIVFQDEASVIHFCGLYIAIALGCSAILRCSK